MADKDTITLSGNLSASSDILIQESLTIRWLEVSGEKVLQQLVRTWTAAGGSMEWVTVPTVVP